MIPAMPAIIMFFVDQMVTLLVVNWHKRWVRIACDIWVVTYLNQTVVLLEHSNRIHH